MFSSWARYLIIAAALCLAVTFIFASRPVVTQEVPFRIHNAVWLATADQLTVIATDTGEAILEFEPMGEVQALSLDAHLSLAWVLESEPGSKPPGRGRGRPDSQDVALRAYDFQGVLLFQFDLDSDWAEGAVDLAVEPGHGGRVWLQTDAAIHVFDVDVGERVGSVNLPADVEAIALDGESSTLYAAYNGNGSDGSAVVALDRDANAASMPRPDLQWEEDIRSLAWDPDRHGLWVATTDRLVFYTEDGIGLDVSVSSAWGKRGLSPDGDSGLWGGHPARLSRVDVSGAELVEVAPFQGYPGAGGLRGLLSDPVNQMVWAYSRRHLKALDLYGVTEFDLTVTSVRNALVDADLYSDRIPPELEIVNPLNGSYTNDPWLPIELLWWDVGTGVDPSSLQLVLNGDPMETNCDADHAQAHCLPLSELQDGEYILSAHVSDYAGNTSEAVESQFLLDTVPPEISIDQPTDGLITNDTELAVEISWSDSASGVDPDSLVLKKDDAPWALTCSTDADGAVCHPENPLEEGVYELTASVSDRAGNRTDPVSAEFEIDTTPPEIFVHEPENHAVVTDPDVTLRGTTDGAASMEINESPVTLSAGDFDYADSLSVGENQYNLIARDEAGNQAELTWNVNFEPNLPSIEVHTPGSQVMTSLGWVQITGRVSESQRLTLNGQEISFNEDGHFETILDLMPGHQLATLVAASPHEGVTPAEYPLDITWTETIVPHSIDLSKITVEEGEGGDRKRVTGQAGSVPAGSRVVLYVYQDGQVIDSATVYADSSGAFDLEIEVPPGSTLGIQLEDGSSGESIQFAPDDLSDGGIGDGDSGGDDGGGDSGGGDDSGNIPSGDTPGTMGGELSVGASGEANYRIPIQVAPGVNGVSPELALLYNSQASDGHIGVGWSLSGLSEISRCPKTIAQDGEPGGVTLTSSDRFCLDGQRLMLVDEIDRLFGASDDDYAAPGSEYRTEIESFQKVVSQGGSREKGPDSFEVRGRDGLIRTYGGAQKVIGNEDGAVATWPIQQITDRFGNSIQFKYEITEDPVEWYPTAIIYGSGSDDTQDPVGRVDFIYEERPDASQAYGPGFSNVITKRLKQISTSALSDGGGQQVFEYNLGYTQSPRSSMSQLEFVQKCADSQCLKPTVFEWDDGDPNLRESGLIIDHKIRWIQPVDLNGDGRLQQLYYGYNGLYVTDKVYSPGKKIWTNDHCQRTSNPEACEASTAQKIRLIDPVGDGMHRVLVPRRYLEDQSVRGYPDDVSVADDEGRLKTTWEVREFDGEKLVRTNFNTQTEDGPSLTKSAPVVGDFTGDGRHDLVLNHPSGAILLWASTGEKFEWQSEREPFPIPIDVITDSQKVFSSELDVDVHVGNIESNGRQDIIVHKIGCESDAGSGCSHSEYRFFGFSYEAETHSLRPIPEAERHSIYPVSRLMLADISGDGGSDFVMGVIRHDGTPAIEVMFNRGGRWQSTGNYRMEAPDVAGVSLADWTGDGRSELFIHERELAGPGDQEWDVYAWRSGLTGQRERGFHQLDTDGVVGLPPSPGFRDYSGDGYLSTLYAPDSLNSDSQDTPRLRMKIATKRRSGSIRSVTDGLGAINHINYRTSLGGHVYAGHTEETDQPEKIREYPYRNSTGAQWLVSTFTVDAGVAEFSGVNSHVVTSYRYYGGKMDISGRGFRGFRQIRSRNHNTGIVTSNTHAQAFPFLGMIVESRQYRDPSLAAPKAISGSSIDEIDDGGGFCSGDYCIEPQGQIQSAGLGALSLVKKTTQELSYKGPDALKSDAKSFFPYVESSKEEYFELGSGNLYKVKEKSSRFDELGNAIEVSVHTHDGSQGDSHRITTINEFSDNESSWCLGRLSHSVATHEYSGAETSVSRTSSFEYDRNTCQLTDEYAAVGTDKELHTEYGFDQYGNIRSKTLRSEDGTRQTEWQYDTGGLFQEYRKDAKENKTYFEWDRRFGKKTSETDPTGVRVRNQYDNFGRLVREVGSPSDRITTHHVDWCGSACDDRAVYYIETHSSTGDRSRTEKDDVGRVVRTREKHLKTRSSGGAEQTDWVDSETWYDALSRPYLSSRPHFAGDNRAWEMTTYDALGRPTGQYATPSEDSCFGGGPNQFPVNDPGCLTRMVANEYNGLTVTKIDANGKVTVQENNVMGWKTRVIDDQGGEALETQFHYTAVGELSRVDREGETTRIFYDAAGHKREMHDPDLGVWTYIHNAFGELEVQTDQRGAVIEIDYNALGQKRERREWIPGESSADSPESVSTWRYDEAGRIIEESISHGHSVLSTYDGHGRLINEVVSIGDQNYETHYKRDDLGRVEEKIYPTGRTGYWIEANGRPSRGDVQLHWGFAQSGGHYEIERDLIRVLDGSVDTETIVTYSDEADSIHSYTDSVLDMSDPDNWEDWQVEYRLLACGESGGNCQIVDTSHVSFSPEEEWVDIEMEVPNGTVDSGVYRFSWAISSNDHQVRLERARYDGTDWGAYEEVSLVSAECDAEGATATGYDDRYSHFQTLCPEQPGDYRHRLKVCFEQGDCSESDWHVLEQEGATEVRRQPLSPDELNANPIGVEFHYSVEFDWMPPENSELFSGLEYELIRTTLSQAEQLYVGSAESFVWDISWDAEDICLEGYEYTGDGENIPGTVNTVDELFRIRSCPADSDEEACSEWSPEVSQEVGYWHPDADYIDQNCELIDEGDDGGGDDGGGGDDDDPCPHCGGGGDPIDPQITPWSSCSDPGAGGCADYQTFSTRVARLVPGEDGDDDSIEMPDPERPAYVVEYEYAASVSALVAVHGGVEDSGDRELHWAFEQSNAFGSVERAQLGGSITNTNHFDAANGWLVGRHAGLGGQAVVNRGYQWDQVGNLESRQDHLRGLSETFEYDSVYRLKTAAFELGGVASGSIQHDYDALGNLEQKGAVSDYAYDGPRPHAVTSVMVDGQERLYEYDANGSMTRSGQLRVEWTSHNKPHRIHNWETGASSRFRYGANRARYYHASGEDFETQRETYYVGAHFERIVDHAEGETTDRHYIRVGGQTVAKVDISSDGPTEEFDASNVSIEYLLRDHQGSVIALITGHGSEASVTAQYDYGPWGDRRPADDLANYSILDAIQAEFSRGYTGHEHLDHLGLVHMNGRVYDPLLGRFLSADPLVPDAGNPLAYNRYAYVLNNPLSYTDPSGYSAQSLAGAIMNVVAGALMGANPAAGIALAAVSGYMQTGTGQGAFVNAIAVGVGGAVGGADLSPFAGAMASGVVAGVLSEAGGGRFMDGFIGGAIGSLVGQTAGLGNMSTGSRFVVASVLGGTMSRLNGGSFTNGAVSAAFAFAVGRATQSGGSTDIWDIHERTRSTIQAGRIGAATDMATSAINAGRINAATELVAGSLWVRPTSGGVRGCCAGGGGGFYASRSRGGQHNATDYIAYPGESVRAVTAGTVIRTGVASYNQETGSSLNMVVFESRQGHVVRQLYMDPASGIKPGAEISAGQELGTYRSIHGNYPSYVPDHVHVDIRYEGQWVNPESLIP